MSNEHKGWVGVDLDGTLALYDGWKGPEHIGDPIKPMVSKVKRWLEEGKTVKVFTARVSGRLALDNSSLGTEIEAQDKIQLAIQDWCEKHIGHRLEVTCVNDYAMFELHDDRAFGYKINTGIRRDSMVAYHLGRVATALGITVTEDSSPDTLAELCTKRILKLNDAMDIAKAQIDSANDALSYVKIEESGGPRSDLNRAKLSVSKAHKAISEL